MSDENSRSSGGVESYYQLPEDATFGDVSTVAMDFLEHYAPWHNAWASRQPNLPIGRLGLWVALHTLARAFDMQLSPTMRADLQRLADGIEVESVSLPPPGQGQLH